MFSFNCLTHFLDPTRGELWPVVRGGHYHVRIASLSCDMFSFRFQRLPAWPYPWPCQDSFALFQMSDICQDTFAHLRYNLLDFWYDFLDPKIEERWPRPVVRDYNPRLLLYPPYLPLPAWKSVLSDFPRQAALTRGLTIIINLAHSLIIPSLASPVRYLSHLTFKRAPFGQFQTLSDHLANSDHSAIKGPLHH